MLWLLRRLFGLDRRSARISARDSAASPGDGSSRPPDARDLQPQESGGTDVYHGLLQALQESLRQHDYAQAASIAIETVPLIRGFVGAWTREHGSFGIQSIPALEQGASLLAAYGDSESLLGMRRVVSSVPELEPWRERIEARIRDVDRRKRLLDAIGNRPGLSQKDAKGAIGESDGRAVATLIAWMEKAAVILRTPAGRSHALWLPSQQRTPAADSEPGEREEEAPLPQPVFTPGHARDSAEPAVLLDLDSIPSVALPRAPEAWDEDRVARARRETEAEECNFESFGPAGFQLEDEQRLPMFERPDPAFRRLAITRSGMFFLDDLGKSQIADSSPAALMAVDRHGAPRGQRPLAWGVHKFHTDPLGQGIAALSREAVLHAYDSSLRPLFSAPLSETAEVKRVQTRLGLPMSEARNHVRNIMLAPDLGGYAFTVADEAWRRDDRGATQWGVRLPVQEGWEPAGYITGPSEAVEAAVSLMDLAFPVSPDDIKKRYRELARAWHPDHNAEPDAAARFRELHDAAELLTGLPSEQLADGAARAYFQRVVSETRIPSVAGIELTMTMSVGTSERYASDWIYASALTRDGGSILAGYSGRIVRIGSTGEPVCLYDIGMVPRRIVDTGRWLYLLSDTRLYILREDRLVRTVDVHDAGELIPGEAGFGLLERKCFRWFDQAGALVGGVRTKNPLRRVYVSDEGWIVETRQRRAHVTGAPSFWLDT